MRAARWLLGWSVLGLAACAAAPGDPPKGAAPKPAAMASLANTRWVGVVPEGAEARNAPRLEFSATGRINGFTGCNMMSGAYRVEEGRVRLGPLMATKRMCLGPEMDYERRVLAAMGEDSKVSREGDRLVFESSKGRFEFVLAKD
jgi:heat shock protein HslJ